MIKKSFAATILISLVCFFTGHVLVGVAVILLELLFDLFRTDDLILSLLTGKGKEIGKILGEDLTLTAGLLGTVLTYGYIVVKSFAGLFSWWAVLMIILYVILPVVWYFKKD